MLLSNAISFVRTRMDEIAYNQDDMLSAALDDRNLDTTIERLLPESVKVVVLSAPSHLLTAEVIETMSDRSGVVDIAPQESFLRLVYIKASDSPVSVTFAYPYDSAEGRMQNNPYLRGNSEMPVAVVYPSDGVQGVRFKYYAMTQAHGSIEIAYIKEPAVDDFGVIFCPVRIEEAALNELTAMVLEAYSDQRSQLFHQKVTTYLAQ